MLGASADLRCALSDSGEPVTLFGGAQVKGIPGVASSQDSLNGDSLIAGRTRTLRFLTVDVPGLKDGQTLQWAGKTWRVIQLKLAGNGVTTRVFLGGA